jgi:CRP-like cAMP-binding protein
MDKIEVLKRSDVFRELNDEQLQAIAELCTEETLEPGTIIHRQNSILHRLKVIEEGLVAILLELGPLSQRQVTAATNFQSIGWSAVVPPYLATTTAKAVEKTKILAFDGHKLRQFCEDNGQIGCLVYRGIASVVAERLHAAFMQCVGVTSADD